MLKLRVRRVICVGPTPEGGAQIDVYINEQRSDGTWWFFGVLRGEVAVSPCDHPADKPHIPHAVYDAPPADTEVSP